MKHGLYLDDVLDSQLHLPSIRYDFKPYPSRSKKEKEDRCERCKNPFDTITFQKNGNNKEAVCSSCEIDKSYIYSELRICNIHLNKVNDLLHQLSYCPRDNMVSIRWIPPNIKLVIYNWYIGIGLHDIYQLRSISNFWPLDDKELINIEQVFLILRKIRDELIFEIKELEKLL